MNKEKFLYPRPRFRTNQPYEKNVESITIRTLIKIVIQDHKQKDM